CRHDRTAHIRMDAQRTLTPGAPGAARGASILLRWLRQAHFRAQPGRTLASVAAVAIGVALALAIHLVNASALDSFRHAIATVNGEADAQVRPAQGLMDEGLLDIVAAVDGIAVASPVLELTVHPEAREPLPLIALDLFAAARITPALMPQAAPGGPDVFEPDAIFLSDGAAAAYPESSILLRQGTQTIRLRVAGRVPGAAAGQALAVMDLGAAQWAFDAVGRLSRIDLQLAPGAALQPVLDRLGPLLPAGLQLVTPEASEQRMSNLSRAYRVNLNVLALVALLTGGFIVFATMSLAAVRQQQEMALLLVLGAPPALASRALLWQGLLVGIWGSVVGVAGGVGLAYLLLNTIGGDLGGGYFSSSAGSLAARPLAIAGFGLLGCATAVLGCLAPARAARRLPAAQALRAGSEETTLRRFRHLRTALVLSAAGAALLLLPPILGLPLAAYLAIAAFLFAGISLIPAVIRAALGPLTHLAAKGLWRRPLAWLAVTRQKQAPASVAVALAGVVASFALTCAMVIMVSSFRLSVDDWLGKVLPADLYARAPAALQGAIDTPSQRAILAITGIERAQFLRSTDMILDPNRAAVLLLARNFEDRPIEQQLPLTGPALEPPAGAVPIYVSEAMVSLYGFSVGSLQRIPLKGESIPVFVAGVWRDYARQTGAVAIMLRDYRRMSGDETVS
ncbi:MAG: ABC transporter permease, partial [Lautropia sp.]|nr:ABC transporter permease [Lautropia sp.]